MKENKKAAYLKLRLLKEQQFRRKKKNEEEKSKPHPLLRMQDCMLDDQLTNPKINVHNLTRLYRYDKSKLNIEKFLKCFIFHHL